MIRALSMPTCDSLSEKFPWYLELIYVLWIAKSFFFYSVEMTFIHVFLKLPLSFC